ncbi:hypothetical protein MNV84_04699 [Leishmania braziliensis]|nr:hypothetical protein MNV84_04699 [Leishmania braziliensis]
MEPPTERGQWHAAGWYGKCDGVASARREHARLGTTLGVEDTNNNQVTSVAAGMTSARQPSQFSLTATTRHHDKSSRQHLLSIEQDNGLGGTHTRQTKSCTAVVAAATAATRPFFSAASVRHPAASVSSQEWQSCSAFFACPPSAADTLPNIMNYSSVSHPALRSRSISAFQQQQLQYLRILSSHSSSAQSSLFYDRPSSAAPRTDDSRLETLGSAAVHSPGSATSLSSGNRFGLSAMNLMKAPPVATTAQMRAFSNKTLYARPRPASFTYTSFSDSQLAEPNHDLAEVLGVGNNSSPTARTQRAGMITNSAARGPEPLSQSRQRRPLSTPRSRHTSTMEEREQAVVGDAIVKAAQRIRSRPESMVPYQQPRQTSDGLPPRAVQMHAQGTRADAADSGTSGCQSGEYASIEENGYSDHFFEEGEASEELKMVIPFTPQAAAGAAGIEIGPAAGEWNLPRIQQRILAARSQAEVHQHFTSAIEILLAVQMSLDVDYQEASQGGGGGESASGFSLTPTQRAYYADLVGRELQYVTALWMAKLQYTESPTLTATAPATNRLREAVSITSPYTVPPDATLATEARWEENRPRSSNSQGSRTSRRTATHMTNSTAASTRQPNGATPAHADVAVNCAWTGHRFLKRSLRKKARVEFQEAPVTQASPHLARPPRDSVTDDFCRGGSEASHLSSVLGDTNSSKVRASSPHTSASDGRVISTTGICESNQPVHVVPACLTLHSTTEFAQRSVQSSLIRQRRTKQPIRRDPCLIEALSTDSSLLEELPSLWDDEVLGPKLHSPFESAVIERVRDLSTPVKKPSANAPKTATEEKSSSHSSPLRHTAESSNGHTTSHRGSLVEDVSSTHSSGGSGRRVSKRRASRYVCQLSPSRLPMPFAEWYATRDAVTPAMVTSEHRTAATALHKTEDAASPVSPHVRSSDALSAVPDCSFRHIPERDRPIPSAETDVDSADAPLSCRHAGAGGSIHSLLRSSSPTTGDTCPRGQPPASSTLSAGAGDFNAAPASGVSLRRPPLYVEDGEQHDELSMSDTSSVAKPHHIARQSVVFSPRWRKSSVSLSIIDTSCDLHLLADSYTDSTHPLSLHRSSGGDDSITSSGIISTFATTITGTGVADYSFTTATARSSIIVTAASSVAEQGENVFPLPVCGLVPMQHSASPLSFPRPQASPVAAHHSPTATPHRSSPTLPTASNTGVQHICVTCVPSEGTAAADYGNHHYPHGHHRTQNLQKGILNGNPGHQESSQLLSSPVSTSFLAVWDEDEQHDPPSSCPHMPYAYEYKAIVCSDGQPHKRLILCKPGGPFHSARLNHTYTGFAAASDASQRGGSESAPSRSLSPTPALTPTYPQDTVSTPAQLRGNESTLPSPWAELHHHERSDVQDDVEANESRTSPVATSTSLVAEQLEECLPLPMLNTQSVVASHPLQGACMADDERAMVECIALKSVEMPNRPLADYESWEAVLTSSPKDESALGGDCSAALINGALINGENEVSVPATVAAPEPGLQDADGNRVPGGRCQFIFSGDVAQCWLDEEGYRAGNYCNPYRVELQRAEATALKWYGLSGHNRRIMSDVSGADVANPQHTAHGGRSVSLAATATVTSAEKPSAEVSAETLRKAGSVGCLHGDATSACREAASICTAPREWLKTRRREQQRQQTPQPGMDRERSCRLLASCGAPTSATSTESRGRGSDVDITKTLGFLRSSVLETEIMRGGEAHVHSAVRHSSLPPASVTQLRRRQL